MPETPAANLIEYERRYPAIWLRRQYPAVWIKQLIRPVSDHNIDIMLRACRKAAGAGDQFERTGRDLSEHRQRIPDPLCKYSVNPRSA